MAIISAAVCSLEVSNFSWLGNRPSTFNLLSEALAERKNQHGRDIEASLSSSTWTGKRNLISSKRPSSVLWKIREDLLTRERSAVQVTEEYLTRLKEVEPHVQSFLYVSDKAIDEARILDEKLSQNADLGLLAGAPIALKDNLCTKDMPSTGGSKLLEGYRPPFDATAVSRLREAGAVILGKTNLDEFGMGGSSENSGFKKTANPWDLSRVPGGSSGGSAAAVAARQCAGALGSDTGGSITQPASNCGVVGLKPSYGRVSRHGLMAFASSLDCVAFLGPSVLDVAILLQAVAGRDKLDSTSSQEAVPNVMEQLLAPIAQLRTKPLTGVRFGLLKEAMAEGVDMRVASAVCDAAKHLQSMGASVVEVSLSTFSLGGPAYYVLATAEASSNLSRYDGLRYGNRADATELMTMYGNSRGAGFGAEVKRRILMGTYVLSEGSHNGFYKRAQQVRALIQAELAMAFDHIDVLLSPVSPTPAYKLGEIVDDPLGMYLGDLMTVNVNLAGLPALAVPCGLAKGGPVGLPVGLQMIGKPFDEGRLLWLGHLFEQTTSSWYLPSLHFSNTFHHVM